MKLRWSIKIMLFIFAVPSALAQQWHWNDQHFQYVVDFDTVNYLDASCCALWVNQVNIIAHNNPSKVQVIPIEGFRIESFIDSNMVVIIEDVNFDGYNDIRVLNWLSVSWYTEYNYWLYHKGTKQFVQDTLLNRMMNPYFDQQYKTIHTYWRYGLNEFGHALYQWNGDTIVLMREAAEHWGIEPDHPGTLVQVNA